MSAEELKKSMMEAEKLWQTLLVDNSVAYADCLIYEKKYKSAKKLYDEFIEKTTSAGNEKNE